MRVQITTHSLKLWLSANDTYRWATRPNNAWPCSDLSGSRLFAEFDSNGLCNIAINGESNADCDVTEFNAITSDHLARKLPEDHPAYFVAVGQFANVTPVI